MRSFTIRPPSFISKRREKREEKERVRDSVISTGSGSNSEPDGAVNVVEAVPVEHEIEVEAEPEEEIAIEAVEERQEAQVVAAELAVPMAQVDTITLHSNQSSASILSNASTLITSPTFAPTRPPRSSRPVSPPYTAHLSHHRSRSDLQRDQQERLAQAWAKAEERRRRQERESHSWPQDPWRGGFGPPSTSNGYLPSQGVAGARHSVAFGNRTAGDFVGFGSYSSALGGGIGGYTGGGIGRPRQRPISYSGAGALGLGGLPIPVSSYGGGGFGAMPGAELLGGGRAVRDEELSREDRRRSGIEQSKEGKRRSVRDWFGRMRSKTVV